ncbi:MAG TPA: OB-fold nucleic acid binding domain-containing protein, partial [bacterium]|nr:OB-fold nucleic acid binding domain-containing protein [bacterium]
MAEKISEFQERLSKLESLQQDGVDAYPAHCRREQTNGQVLANFEHYLADETVVYLAGRLRSKREHGNLTFADLQDGTATIQLAFNKKELEDKYKQFLKFVDVGDFVEVSGKVFMTHAGQQSVLVNDWHLISKALLPLPEKWHGLQDDDERLRKRYLDLLFDDNLRDIFAKKAKFWQVTRRFLIDRGF